MPTSKNNKNNYPEHDTQVSSVTPPASEPTPEEEMSSLQDALTKKNAELKALVEKSAMDDEEAYTILTGMKKEMEEMRDRMIAIGGKKGVNIILNGETEIEKKLNFIPEFQDQMKALEDRGVLIVQNGVKGIVGWDKKFYKAPTEEHALKQLRAFDQKLLAYKMDQEMTQVVLVDFATSWVDNVKLLTEVYKQRVLSGKLLRTDDAKTPLTTINDTQFCFGENESNVLYRTPSGDLKLKGEVVGDGFKLLLLPNDPRIPRQGEGKNRGGRPDLEAKQKGKIYRDVFYSQDPAHPYRGEGGLTIEAWISWAFLMCRKHGQVLHDYYENPKDSGCCLTGNELKNNGTLPLASFLQDSGSVYLFNADPEDYDVDNGSVGSVEIRRREFIRRVSPSER